MSEEKRCKAFSVSLLQYCAILLIFSPLAWGEFRVNRYTTGNQENAAIATDGYGNYLAVWSCDGTYGSTAGIFGRRFDSAGNALGSQFRVDVGLTTEAAFVDAAMDERGNLVVVWQGKQGGDEDIFARCFDANGTPFGNEFRVNTLTNYRQIFPKVARSDGGSFVIGWQCEKTGTSGKTERWAIKARLYNSQNQPNGDEMEISLLYQANRVDAAMDDMGNFAFVWVEDNTSTNAVSVLARIYWANKTPRTDPFILNQTAVGPLARCSISMAGTGNFVTAWSQGFDSGGDDIFVRRYKFDGTPKSDEFMVNMPGDYICDRPVIMLQETLDFTVIWQTEMETDSNETDIRGQRFERFGRKIGNEFRLNTCVVGKQCCPDGAITEVDDGFFAIWQSRWQDNWGWGIYGEVGPLTGWADFNNDGIVNFADYRVLAQEWLEEGDWLAGDLRDDNVIDGDDLEVFSQQWLVPRYDCEQADVSGDGKVNFADYAIFANNWQKTQPGLDGDITGDGQVNSEDLQALIFHWPATCE